MCHVSALGSVCGSYTQCDAQEATDTDAGEMQVTVDDRRLKTGSSLLCFVVETEVEQS